MTQQDAIRQIKTRIKLVDMVRRYVELRQNGGRWVAPCPFHQETKPSFSVNDEQGLFYCFGCQAAGDLFDFYGRINGLDFRETLEQLAEEAGVRLERFETQGGRKSRDAEAESGQRRKLLLMHELAGAYYTGILQGPEGSECREYMARRGISDEAATAFGLGYSPRAWQGLADALQQAGFSAEEGVRAALLAKSDKGRVYDRFRGRLMFPIKSLSGGIVAFGGRIIGDEDEAKYINSSDSPLYKKGAHLYGLQQSRKAITTGKPAMLTEGYMDVVTLHQFGYAGAVGVLGTALTPEQVKRLAGFAGSVELLFDGDRAGRKAALRAVEMFLVRGMSCKVVLFPDGEDIDSLLRTHGQAMFESLRSRAPQGIDFCVRVLGDMSPGEAVEWARRFLAHVEQPELLGRYASALAVGLGLSEEELRQGMVTARAQAAASQTSQRTGNTPVTPPAAKRPVDREIMTFAVRYPHELQRLKHAGARFYLKEPWSRTLWDKMEQTPPDDVFHTLDEREKVFWIRCRTSDAPPLNNVEGEFAAIRGMIEKMRLVAQSASVSAALKGAGTADFETDLEYLRALQETLERTHGEH